MRHGCGSVDGSRAEQIEQLATVPLLIVDDLGMRKLPATAAEDLLELVMRRYERASTLVTSIVPPKLRYRLRHVAGDGAKRAS